MPLNTVDPAIYEGNNQSVDFKKKKKKTAVEMLLPLRSSPVYGTNKIHIELVIKSHSAEPNIGIC